MGLETISSGANSTIADLNPAWPLVGEGVGQGDDHIRNTKQALQLTFPNISATVSGVAAELAFAHKGGTVSGTAVFMFDININAELSVSGAARFQSKASFLAGFSASGTNTALVTSAVEADHAKSASFALSAAVALSAVHAVNADVAQSASHAVLADQATYALSALWAQSSSWAVQAGYATSASSAMTAAHAISADTALSANHAGSASYANSAAHALSANFANSASYAYSAVHALSASSVNGIKTIPIKIQTGGSFATVWNPFSLSATHSGTGLYAISHNFGVTAYAVNVTEIVGVGTLAKYKFKPTGATTALTTFSHMDVSGTGVDITTMTIFITFNVVS